MSMNLFELKSEHKAALDTAEAALGTNGHAMTASETEQYETSMKRATAIEGQIKARERMSTIRSAFPSGMPGLGLCTDGNGEMPIGFMQTLATAPSLADTRQPEYAKSLVSFLRTGGKAHGDELIVGADGQGGYHIPGSEQYTRQRFANGSFPKMYGAAYEGTDGNSNAAGGYTVSVPTVLQIVPLALPDLGIFDAAMVIPTATDIKIPQQASFGTAAIKAESTGTTATFGGNDPAFGQIELRSYMVGALRLASWELLQDVQAFQQFIVDDLLRGQRILEGQLLATGTGSANSQPQGAFGNTGTGTGAAYALTGAATDGTALLNSLFDVTATLKGAYQANASWVMSRATGLAIRRAQMQTNLFVPVATVDADGTERILGKPVFYDVNAPALPTATTAGVVPVLYGDFKSGYIVGVRGGAGINVKILDQPWAAQGQLGILAYRRIDGKVRRSEAIQAVTFSHA